MAAKTEETVQGRSVTRASCQRTGLPARLGLVAPVAVFGVGLSPLPRWRRTASCSSPMAASSRSNDWRACSQRRRSASRLLPFDPVRGAERALSRKACSSRRSASLRPRVAARSPRRVASWWATKAGEVRMRNAHPGPPGSAAPGRAKAGGAGSGSPPKCLPLLWSRPTAECIVRRLRKSLKNLALPRIILHAMRVATSASA